jgi:hypothetical protein
MKAPGQPEGSDPPKDLEFVPKEDLDRAQRENEQLRKQIERLKQETSACARNWKQRCGLASGRLLRIRVESPNATPSGRAASRAGITAGRRAVPFRLVSMSRSRFLCRNDVRTVAARWNRKLAQRSIRKTSSGRRSCAALISR